MVIIGWLFIIFLTLVFGIIIGMIIETQSNNKFFANFLCQQAYYKKLLK